jgi:hypothetical protein
MTIKRRDFLGTVAAGSAVVTMPVFLSGCGVQPATSVKVITPANPFLAGFGVDQVTSAKVMSEVSGSGADRAVVYLQHIGR